MARLNTHASATPLQSRATTVDSLYRDPSTAPQHRDGNHGRPSSYSVVSPSQSMTSDKENEQPDSRHNTPLPTKARYLSSASARMPTPDSGSTAGSRGNKRRRTGDYSINESSIYQDEPDVDQDYAMPSQNHRSTMASSEAPRDEDGNLEYYNPNQDPDQRRRLRASMRDHQRAVEGECRLKVLLHAQG